MRGHATNLEFASRRFRNRFDASQQENISRDPQKQKSRRADKRSRERMCRLYDIARKNWRSNSSKLIAKIQNSTECADAFSWSDQRRDRPSYRRSGGQSADRHADPEKRRHRTICVRCAENSQTKNCSANKHHLANARRAPTALYQRIHEPPTHHKVRERGEQ